MKNIVLLGLLFSCTLLFAQEDELPQTVKDNYQKKYPSAVIDDWRLEDDMYYIDFNIKSNSYTSVYSKKGEWIETAEIISDFDLPVQLQNYITKNFPHASISYGELVEFPGSRKNYRANVYDDEDNFILITCNMDGTGIKVISNESAEFEE